MARSRQQAIVIGLGQFGTAVARALAERGVDVMAIDRDEDRVQAIAAQVSEALCFDASDQEALERTSPASRDVCVCAIGDEAKEASIICTALLRQAGAKRVIARANDDVHARILKLVGAHQVVNPERAFGDRFASQIVHEGVKGEMLVLRTKDVSLARPIRMLHPRRPVYIVPRTDPHEFMVGASMVENEEPGRITARSMMELLGSAYTICPAFAEAEIVEVGGDVRPTYPDNLPRLTLRDRTLAINGLYRHGFLLAPARAARAADVVMKGAHFPELMQ